MSRVCLIAEADPFIASLLQRFAEESGLPSARARTGEEIGPLVEEVESAVLIVDPELPGRIRGWQAVRAIRTGKRARDVAVISCSWSSQIELRKLIGEVAGHLQKPDLHYADFVQALAAAGITPVDPGESNSA